MDGEPREGCQDDPPALLARAVEQFNRGEYFEQHETFEVLWRAERGAVRALYQGVLQIGVAFHHLRRGNFHGAVVMLDRGVARLAPFAPRCRTVEVALLLADAARARAAIAGLGPTRLAEFDWTLAPRVHLSTDPAAE